NSSAYTDLDGTRAVIGQFNQFQSQNSTNLSQDWDMTFRRNADKSLPLFSTELEYSNNKSTSDVNLSGDVLQVDPTTPLIRTERDHANGRYPYLNWKTDFTKQFGATTKLETGVKLNRRETANVFDASYL